MDNRLYEVVVRTCNALSRMQIDYNLSQDQREALYIAYLAMSLVSLKPGVCDRNDMIKLIQIRAGRLK